MATNESDSGDTFQDDEISLSRSIRFWILILFDFPSVICSFILLTHLLINRTARSALNNHAIVILILFGLPTQLMDVPLYLTFIINSGNVTPAAPSTCIAWWFAAFAFYNGQQILLAWTAIERHILIFNSQWATTKRGRFFSHYLPLILLLLYISTFYSYVLLIFPCENTYEYDLPVCNAYPCYQNDLILGTWDFFGHNILPAFLVASVSMALLIRVIRQKQRLNQQVQWSKHRKMTKQLVSMSILNIIFILPLNLLTLAHLCGLPDEYGAQLQLYFYFAGYLFIFFIPFACTSSTPGLSKKIKLIFSCQDQTQTAGNTSINGAVIIARRRR
ncbi:unnamed protein product [Adineta steineri]|uniref:G-protein coupled receptors family 1 profile domain-containing protein n=1 Tax=Adineta steineri TaxID=433720 RepID=A0A819AM98_9BILA|nr:unnamed protein product [Adineta steineri]CAF3786427.1 unnamed protein product [Adineta steineri]